METTSKNILYVSHIIISTIASSHISSGLLAESSLIEDLFKKQQRRQHHAKFRKSYF
jgi:hypothetical protein